MHGLTIGMLGSLNVMVDEALRLCRGRPFDGLDSRWLEETDAPRLVEWYLAALERRVDLDIAGRRHRNLVAELCEFTARYPVREWLGHLLVMLERYEQIRAPAVDAIVDSCGRMSRPLTTAATRFGQQATSPLDLHTSPDGDAWRAAGGATLGMLLRTWRNRALLTQEQLAERTGLSARTIRRLEGDVSRRPRVASVRLLSEALNLDATERAVLAAAGAASSEEDPTGTRAGRTVESPAVVPWQLPADVATFVGRERELAVFDEVDDGSATAVIAIDGMAGIGKTALAVHAAHRVTPRFRAGALFVDLHGYTRGRAPVDPSEVLERFLRNLEMPSGRIPQRTDERAAVYRSLLAGRKILVVLDNAASEEQVRPLLPGTPGCTVLVTSRRHLAGLERTRTVTLEGLSLPEAVALFVVSAGKDRLAATDPHLLDQVVRRCAMLPLAIYVAAARLRAHPAWSVRDLLELVDEQGQRLAELEAGERSVAAAFDLSYRELTDAEQRAYRLLSLHPGIDFGPRTAASLLASSVVEARRLIDRLVSAHLLQEPTAGRYRFHELVRDHARSTGDSPITIGDSR